MQRRQKLLLAKSALIAEVIPILASAFETGPDPSYWGVPGENGAQSGCHVGSSGQGSVSVAFPNGQTYAPGVKQLDGHHFGPGHNPTGVGLPAHRAKFHQYVSAGGIVRAFRREYAGVVHVPNPGRESLDGQGCPSFAPVAYVEHTLTGVHKTLGQKGSATFEFDWTPPASSTGSITFYVAGNAGLPAQPFMPGGSHIYTNPLTPSAVLQLAPAIDPTLGVENQTTGPNTPGQPVSGGVARSHLRKQFRVGGHPCHHDPFAGSAGQRERHNWRHRRSHGGDRPRYHNRRQDR